MIKEVRIRSRHNMKQESYVIDEPCIIISIRDVEAEPICFAINDCIKAIKFFAFEDWDDPDDPWDITKEQAKEIATFVNKWAKKEEPITVYVNCEAGISRSAGVAAAISKHFLGDDSWIFNDKIKLIDGYRNKYFPNPLCYKYVLEALANL